MNIYFVWKSVCMNLVCFININFFVFNFYEVGIFGQFIMKVFYLINNFKFFSFMILCKEGILFLDFLEVLYCVNQDLNYVFNLRLIVFNCKFFVIDCVDVDICEFVEVV